MKKSEVSPLATAWVDLEGITISEIRLSEKDTSFLKTAITGTLEKRGCCESPCGRALLPHPLVNTGLWGGWLFTGQISGKPPNHCHFTPPFGGKPQPQGTDTPSLTTPALARVPLSLLLARPLAPPHSERGPLPGSL